MFGGKNKVTIDPELMERIKKISEVAGYASHEEYKRRQVAVARRRVMGGAAWDSPASDQDAIDEHEVVGE